MWTQATYKNPTEDFILILSDQIKKNCLGRRRSFISEMAAEVKKCSPWLEKPILWDSILSNCVILIEEESADMNYYLFITDSYMVPTNYAVLNTLYIHISLQGDCNLRSLSTMHT